MAHTHSPGRRSLQSGVLCYPESLRPLPHCPCGLLRARGEPENASQVRTQHQDRVRVESHDALRRRGLQADMLTGPDLVELGLGKPEGGCGAFRRGLDLLETKMNLPDQRGVT